MQAFRIVFISKQQLFYSILPCTIFWKGKGETSLHLTHVTVNQMSGKFFKSSYGK